MNWKKILRSAMCLLVVLSILLNCVPVKADAVAGALIAGKVVVDAIKVITAILIGLGVTAGISNTDWEALRVHILADLSNKGFVDSEGNIHVFTTQGTDFLYGVSSDVIGAVRSLLYSEGYLYSDSIVNANGFSVVDIVQGYYLSTYFQSAASTWPSEFVSCLSSLGVSDKVMILGVDERYLYGYFFDASGRFIRARFHNRLMTPNASLIGVHSISDLELYDYSDQITTISSGETSYRIYYSKYYAEKDPSYLTSDIVAFDFTGLPYYGVYDSLLLNSSIFFRFFIKRSTSTTWSNDLDFCAVSPTYLGPISALYGPYWEYIIWDSLTDSVVSSSYDLTLENVASEDKSLSDSYPLWSAGAITVPGSDVGSEEDEVHLYPLGLGGTLEDTESLTQSDIWTGANVSTNTNTNTGTLADALTNALSKVFVPSEDYLTAKVDALASNFPFITPIVTLARAISVGFSQEDPEPPVIYIHLEDARGSYVFGDTVPFIDMTWYAEFKPIGDALLSSLLWVVFVWRLFRQLPGLIAGMPGDYNARILDALHITPPSRNMAMEVQRQSNREAIKTAAKNKGGGSK